MEIPFKPISDDIGKVLLRASVGGLMLFHGVFKMRHGIEWLVEMLQQKGLPGFFGYGVFVGEVLAPLLIIAGFRTRLAALVVAFDMIMAVALVLSGQMFSVKEMGGGWGIELEAFFFLGALVLFFIGAGKFAVSKNNTWD